MKPHPNYPGSRLRVRYYNDTCGIVVTGPEDDPLRVCPDCHKIYDERDGHECEKEEGCEE